MIGKPERAISSASDDRLGRKQFVERLCDSLVDRAKGASSGVVLGITGPWGSGKSSVLNMVEEQLRADHKDIVIVRFDPWLISGSNDLISQFMAELTFAVNDKAKSASSLKKIGSQLSSYGAMLSPGINLLLPGLGTAVQGGFKAASKALSSEGSLSAMRAVLVSSLSDVTVPIVVLIDELDRVEDTEILTVAQLVRAVVDFPRVSFALAYDVDRVVQALGRSSTERGRAYLEKIVQLQVPLPIQMPSERALLLHTELERMDLRDHDGHPLDLRSSSYEEIVALLNAGFLDTPRDVKRLCGTFQALYGMVGHEVAWVELLAYSAMLTKHPQLVERIRREPERVIFNTIDSREIERRARTKADDRMIWFADMLDGTSAREARELALRLFPILDTSAKSDTPLPNALGFRRPLLTTLRLGLIPGDFSREDATSILDLDRNDSGRVLTELSGGDRLTALIDRLDGVVSEQSSVEIGFWMGMADFLSKHDADPLTTFPVQRNVGGEVIGIVTRACARNPNLRDGYASVLRQLIESGEIGLSSGLVRQHFFVYGMHGYGSSRGRGWFLNVDQTKRYAESIAEIAWEQLKNDALLSQTYSLEPLYLLQAMSRQNATLLSAVDRFISTPGGVDTMSILWYGSGFRPGKSFVEQFCDPKSYLAAIKSRRLSLRDDERTVAEALTHAEEALTGSR